MFRSLSLSDSKAWFVAEKVDFVLAAYLLQFLLGLILESLNLCNCGFWSSKVSLSY
ncbi:hypothetical protein VAA_04028 [Vibrio anguillarum 775]|nr:hypothetical protein VAA_04028 [Vibrio anguillarum 775]AGU59931.1 hypothetical protein N175_19195 [Vibrio anguillarum M3]